MKKEINTEKFREHNKIFEQNYSDMLKVYIKDGLCINSQIKEFCRDVTHLSIRQYESEMTY